VIKRDILLFGTLQFYDRGFIYTDERLGLLIVPYTFVRKFTFHFDNDRVSDWLEVTMNQFEGKNMLPAQLIAEERFYV